MNADGAPAHLASTLQAAGRAAVWLALAFSIALVGLAAALMAVTAFVLQAAGALLKSLAELALAALPVVLGIIPGLARLLCLGFALGATAYAGWRLAVGLGGDWLALGLAGLLAPTPFMTLYVSAPSWPRALAAGLVAGLLGAAAQAAPPAALLGAIFVVFAWLMTRRMEPAEPAGEQNAEPGEDVVAQGRLE